MASPKGVLCHLSCIDRNLGDSYNKWRRYEEKEVGILTDNRRVVVRLPHDLVDALDQVASGEGRHRSELIRESVEYYLAEQRRQEIREALIEGYQEMGFLNSALAEERWDLVGFSKE